jgi:hypothetical protein
VREGGGRTLFLFSTTRYSASISSSEAFLAGSLIRDDDDDGGRMPPTPTHVVDVATVVLAVGGRCR